MKTPLKEKESANKPVSEGLYGLIRHTPSKEYNHFIHKVIKESNRDQRELVDQYNKKLAQA